MSDLWHIGNEALESRLIIGSGKLGSNTLIPRIVEASGAEIMTLALRRVDLENKDEDILTHIPQNMKLLPNTSGARNAEEAIRIARLAREMGCGNWVKLEIIRDTRYLMPDNLETIKATAVLSKEGFSVLPYMCPDPMAARYLEEAGAATIMPLGSPIGSNMGLKATELIKMIIENANVPVIVDAGIGKPSDATQAMELGATAVMLNTAIATSPNPIEMASAFKHAVIAGRLAYLAGLGRVLTQGEASSPLTGFLTENEAV